MKHEDFILKKLKERNNKQQIIEDQWNAVPTSFKKYKRISPKPLSYISRSRADFFKPEYDFQTIQIAQETDSYTHRAIKKKINKIICARYSFVGENSKSVSYIKRRFLEFQFATGLLTEVIIQQILSDLFRYSNAMIVFANKPSSKNPNLSAPYGGELKEIGGVFVLPFETLSLKKKPNGELKEVRQRMPDGDYKIFQPKDLVHFFTDRKPGFSVGTPDLWPALDDIQLLRRIEENVEELIESNLFPVFHYTVGTDNLPERVTPSGEKESDIIKRKIEYMPASGIYISDHRHKIQAVGSESKALKINDYLDYFKKRVFAALGVSSVDMGEGDSSNRSTASTMSKAMILDVMAVAYTFQEFFNFFVISRLLMEGGYDPFNEYDQVRIEFGAIDQEEKRSNENHYIQCYQNNAITMDEMRIALGMKPWDEEMFDRSYYKMFGEPNALLSGLGPGTAAAESLSRIKSSNIEPGDVAKEKKIAEKLQKSGANHTGGVRKTATSSGVASSSNRNTPSNQHQTRSTSKTNRDFIKVTDPNGKLLLLETARALKDEEIEKFKEEVHNRYKRLGSTEVDFDLVAKNILMRYLRNT